MAVIAIVLMVVVTMLMKLKVVLVWWWSDVDKGCNDGDGGTVDQPEMQQTHTNSPSESCKDHNSLISDPKAMVL